jgi:hypothetical protein
VQEIPAVAKARFLSLAIAALLVFPAAASAQQPGYVLQTATFGPAVVPNVNYSVSATNLFAAPFSVGTLTQVTAVGAGNLFSGNGTLFAAIVTSLGDPVLDSSVVAFTVFSSPSGGNFLTPLTATLLPGDYYLVIGSGRFGATSTNAVIQVSGTTVGSPSVLFYAANTNHQYVPLAAAQPLRLVVTGGPDAADTFVVNSVNSFTASRASQDSLNAIATAVGTKASQASVNQLGADVGTAITSIGARATQASLDTFSASVAAQLSKLLATTGAGASQSSIDAFSTSVATEFSKLFAGPDARASQSSLDAFSAGVSAQFSKLLTGADARASQSSVDSFSTSVAAQFSKLFTGADARASQSSLDTLTTSVATGTQVSSLGTSVGTANATLGSLGQSVGSLGAAIALLPQQANLTAVATSVNQNVGTRASQASVDALAAKLNSDQTLRLAIERALSEGRQIVSFLLPASVGGKLDVVREVVDEMIVAAQQAGLSVSKARAALLRGDAAKAAGNFRVAYAWYANAYQLIAGTGERDDR